MIQPKFDPITGLPVKTGPPPINTRVMLFHEVRPAVIVEGVGANDAEKRADAARQIKAKQSQGYTLTRPHGQHPHSFDDHRMDMQRRAAEAGDKEAAAALGAKAKQSAAKNVAAPVSDVAALQAQVAELAGQLAKLTSKSA